MNYKLTTTAIAALLLLSPLAIGQSGHSGSKKKAGSGIKAMADGSSSLESMLEARAAKSAEMMPPELLAKAKKQRNRPTELHPRQQIGFRRNSQRRNPPSAARNVLALMTAEGL